MTDSNRQADALLTEHFQYTPLSLIDDIINAVNIIVYQAIEALETCLLQVPPRELGFMRSYGSTSSSGSPGSAPKNGSTEPLDPTAEIENGVHQLETLLEATVDKAFDKFEIWTLRNILTIPDDLAPYVRLAHYENLELPLSPTAPTPESILLLRRKLQETRKLNLALRSTHNRNTALISHLSALLSPPTTSAPNTHPSSLAFLTAPTNPAIQALNLSFSPSAKDAKPLTTNAQFAISQLPALRQLVAELRPKMRDLKEGMEEKVDWESRREERRMYIEMGSRMVVGKGAAAGEELGGERRGKEEVEGLEGLIGGIGRRDRMEE